MSLLDNTEYTSSIPTDILDDLCSRFIVNVPMEMQHDPVRLFFLIEEAHWFYLDFYCTENPHLKTCGMHEFTLQMINNIPYLKYKLDDAGSMLQSWKRYKAAVPTYGAILLNQDLSKVLLVQSFFSKASWGFPKGKINKDEDVCDCAIREVLEETGFDISSLIKENEFIEVEANEQTVRLYLIQGVNEDTKFNPQTRNEIKSVEWFLLSELPTSKKDLKTPNKIKTTVAPRSFFMVMPFIKKIKRWIELKQRHQTVKLTTSESTQSRRRLSNETTTDVDSTCSKHVYDEEQKVFPSCNSCKKMFGEDTKLCISSWLNFKLNTKEIVKCFDD